MLMAGTELFDHDEGREWHFAHYLLGRAGHAVLSGVR